MEGASLGGYLSPLGPRLGLEGAELVPKEGLGGTSKPCSNMASSSSPPSVSALRMTPSCGKSSATGGGAHWLAFSLYAPIWPPHWSSSDVAIETVSSFQSDIATEWCRAVRNPPAPGNDRSSSRFRFSSRRSLRSRDRSQSSHRRIGTCVSSARVPAPSSCPFCLPSPSTRLQTSMRIVAKISTI